MTNRKIVVTKGVFVHNKPDCNCPQAAIKSNFFVASLETKRWNTRKYWDIVKLYKKRRG